MIINRLIRSEKNIYRRPDFTKDEIEPYVILTVQKALEKNPSPLIGLSFQYLKRQLLSHDMFEERDDVSYIDPFFKTKIPTDNLIKYRDYYEQYMDDNEKHYGSAYGRNDDR